MSHQEGAGFKTRATRSRFAEIDDLGPLLQSLGIGVVLLVAVRLIFGGSDKSLTKASRSEVDEEVVAGVTDK